MNKHTQGKWFISNNHEDNGNMQIGSDRDYICQIYPRPNDGISIEANEPQSLANAHLIASAPELLEALKEAKSLIDNLTETMSSDDIIEIYGTRYVEILNVISKAERKGD